MLKRFSMLFLVFVLALTVSGPAVAADKDQTTEISGIGGLMRPKGNRNGLAPLATNPLIYHGGPIMKSSKVFTIFWIPAGYSVSTTYKSLINRYFKDVAAASGATSNVYYTQKQYYMSGPVYVSGKTVFGGTYTDTTTFPASGCDLYGTVIKCLTDSQIKAAIKRAIATKGWTANATNMFFLFTPDGVGSCAGGQCAYTDYCAYHGYSGAIIYANQPYTDTYADACGVPKSPSGDVAADSTINAASNTHRAAINNYRLNAWFDSDGYEGADKCAWNFGSLTIGYNQTINGHRYVLQKEWSNHSNGCVLSGN